MLIMWTGGAAAAPFDDQAVLAECDSWRQDLGARGLHVLGSALGSTDTATTVRVRDGETLLGHGPFTTTKGFIAGIDVLSCADHAHPFSTRCLVAGCIAWLDPSAHRGAPFALYTLTVT